MEGNRQVKVSVIVPMYNVSGVMARSLESILRQRLEDVEYIFVDDCSSDDTAAAVERWIDEHRDFPAHFRLLRHERNMGVACARNTGLDNATGEYIYYLDADDWIADETLAAMYGKARESDADIVGSEWTLSFSSGERRIHHPQVDTGEELFCKLCHGTVRWNLWVFMVRRELIENLHVRFIPGNNMGEDMMAMLKLALSARRVAMINEPFYHYVQTNSGALTRNWTDEHRRQVTENVAEAESFVHKQHGSRYDRQFDCLKLNVKLPLIISDRKADYEKWQQWFPEAARSIFANPDISMRTKLLQWAAAKRLYLLLKIYHKIITKVLYGLIYK